MLSARASSRWPSAPLDGVVGERGPDILILHGRNKIGEAAPYSGLVLPHEPQSPVNFLPLPRRWSALVLELVAGGKPIRCKGHVALRIEPGERAEARAAAVAGKVVVPASGRVRRGRTASGPCRRP